MAANSESENVRSNDSEFTEVNSQELEVLEKTKTTLDSFLKLIRWISNDVQTITSNLELLSELQNAVAKAEEHNKPNT